MSTRRRSTAAPGKDQTCRKIERMEIQREERRRAALERKKARAAENERNIAAGNPGDVDFIGMVKQWREQHFQDAQPHNTENNHPRICICVRKRPVSDKERAKNDHDSVTVLNPTVWIHAAKFKVDGITKYLNHTSFTFDHAFDENETTEDIYKHTTMPLLDFCVSGVGGRATVFLFGQTGSGKTYTVQGIQQILAEDLFLLLNEEETGGCTAADTVVMVSFFELYGGFIQDLLNDRKRLKLLEDGKGEVNVTGLTESAAETPKTFLELIEAGNEARTTHMTEANDTSSRSHAICQIMLRDRKTLKLYGKLSLVDLAGSERGGDTKSHNAQRRTESSEINTSLLALKECIRALDGNKAKQHVPYRTSKLTLILKDCFTSESAMTTMIATVSPGASAADHSLNTLRYADRTKDKSAKKSPVRSPARRGISPKATSVGGPTVPRSKPVPTQSAAEEETLRQTVNALFEQEEAILSTHMSNIHSFAELLAKEGQLLADVQRPGRTENDIERYATALEEVLEQKEDMIDGLRKKMNIFKEHLRKEQELSTKVGSLNKNGQ